MLKMNAMAAACLMIVACGGPPSNTGNRCTTNADCSNDTVCFEGLCRGSGDQVDAGSQDAGPGQDTGSGNDTGSTPSDTGTTPTDGGQATPVDAGSDQCENADCPCEDESSCPYTHYCNRRDGQCAPLPPGTCRDDRSCDGECNIPEGRTVGRCVDCQVDADCVASAPRTRCLNNTCRLPEGQCENNADCGNGEECVNNRCEGGGGGGCNAQNCPAPGQCVQNQCLGGGGGGQGECTVHADCGPAEQCLDLGGMAMCMQKCNEGAMGAICALPNLPLCICNMAGLTCNQQSGFCE
jgi:hypothetical protein